MQTRPLLIEHVGNNVVQLETVRLNTEECFAVIAAKNYVIATAGNV
ncbi:MAG TPA: hypothetical protein VIT67_07045 [Povalibacter sp.]